MRDADALQIPTVCRISPLLGPESEPDGGQPRRLQNGAGLKRATESASTDPAQEGYERVLMDFEFDRRGVTSAVETRKTSDKEFSLAGSVGRAGSDDLWAG